MKTGTYYRLTDFKSSEEKEMAFLQGKNKFTASQSNFSKIPGSPIAYWVSDKVIEIFEKKKIGDIATSSPGVRTGKDQIFIRYWHEVKFKDISTSSKKFEDIKSKIKKWYPITRGGEYRKWFGNTDNIINLYDEAREIKTICPDYRLRDPENYFKEGVSWTMISSSKPSFRFIPEGVLFGNGGPVLYSNFEYLILGFLNTVLCENFLDIINPTINYTKSDIEKLPIITKNEELSFGLIKNNIALSKTDWDSRETSWEFKQLRIMNYELRIENDGSVSLEAAYNRWKEDVTNDFYQLHANEEELNRIFIDIYGLKDELTPDVPLKDITILQDELDRAKLEEIEEDFRKFLSSTVGYDSKNEGSGMSSPVLRTPPSKGDDEDLSSTVGYDSKNEGSGMSSHVLRTPPSKGDSDGLSSSITDPKGDEVVVGDFSSYPELPFKKDVVIQQILHYAVGCFMGRYRLGIPGLHIAHPDPTAGELQAYDVRIPYAAGSGPSSSEAFEIDADAIIPVMGSDSPFSDDIVNRVKKFIEITWGPESLTANLNFINSALGMDMEKWLVNNFWDYHKRIYKKKPIYWMFASARKNPAFRVIAYMHRMDKYTVQKIQHNYLHRYQEYLREEFTRLNEKRDSLPVKEMKRLSRLENAIMECRGYDEILKALANKQVEFDLDDGVTENYKLFGEALLKI